MAVDVAALAASGASTLIGLMTAEGWEQIKGRLARFFARSWAGGRRRGGGRRGGRGAVDALPAGTRHG